MAKSVIIVLNDLKEIVLTQLTTNNLKMPFSKNDLSIVSLLLKS